VAAERIQATGVNPEAVRVEEIQDLIRSRLSRM
jgi:hypothetical protein